MKNNISIDPRTFSAGSSAISDYGKVCMEPGEMISVVGTSGKECDITATNWGFYLGASVNDRLKRAGYKVAIVRNSLGKIFVNAVENDKLAQFEEYLSAEGQNAQVISWIGENE